MTENKKPLHVAVIVKNTPSAFLKEGRNMGLFSYEVNDEFTWEFIAPQKYSILDTAALRRKGFDLIFHEDSNWCTYKHGAIPTVFYSIDSTLSELSHYVPRYRQARQADLVLIDHDRLERFHFPGKNTRRLLYCVNDHLFRSSEKTIDINFNCGSSDRRAFIRGYLGKLCIEKQWQYGSGVLPLPAYAEALGKSKIVVNVPRNDHNRPHRVYDSLACKTFLLSMPFPKIEAETFMHGFHYMNFVDSTDLRDKLIDFMEADRWQKIAEQGYYHIMQKHIWSVRAKELRQIIHEEFSI